MPKYYGCPCEGCGRPLALTDDIVVCPDCGAPYHRECYEKLGRCIHTPAHGAGYEWTFPYKDDALRTCPSCGERTLRTEERCRCCGAVLPPESQCPEPPTQSQPGTDADGRFDYNDLYRQYQQTVEEPTRRNVQAAFGKEELIDGIPYSDWNDYIGKAAPVYLNDYSRMQLQHTKISMCFSALVFGPFYFFYRKAWKPAFGFLAAELVVALPTLPGMAERTIVVNGFSKTYAMTGWRLGYACGPAPIIRIMTKIHQSAIMSAPTTSQYAAITALKECDGEIDRMRDEYNMRRRLVVKSFNDMGLTCFEPRGAFYAFPCIKSTGMSSQDFCTKLLEQKHVAIIPGDAFGASGEGYARISYAYSVEHLKEALRRIREFLQENGIYHGI